MKFLISTLAFLFSWGIGSLAGATAFLPAQAGLTAQTQLAGRLILWERELCPTLVNCPLPKAFGPEILVDLKFAQPTPLGSHLVVDQNFQHQDWKIDLIMVWVNPGPGQDAYLVTQMRLSEKNAGFIAECSRYDGVSELKFLPPGSCSGKYDSKIIGVSFLSPAP